MKLGIIGYGNIGQLITENLLKLQLINEENLVISNRTIKKLDEIKQYYPNIQVTNNNIELAKECEKIIICVKPNEFKDILLEIKPYLNEKRHIIHTCAGINFKDINEYYEGSVTTIIPTITSSFTSREDPQKGISLILHNDKVNFLNQNYIETIFNRFSYVKILLNEEDLEIATILTSCGGAFIAQIIKTISEKVGENSSFTNEECEYLINKTLIGTGLVLNSNISTDEVMDKVATKGGITEKGLNYLEEVTPEINEELFKILLKEF